MAQELAAKPWHLMPAELWLAYTRLELPAHLGRWEQDRLVFGYESTGVPDNQHP